jgi:hypothetical protein
MNTMIMFPKIKFWLQASFSLIVILALCGCASILTPIVRHIPDSESTPTNPTNTFNEVFLYTSWFRGMFGDGNIEWDGLVSDNELVVGWHPATKSEFDFKVRAYPALRPQYSDKTNFLREIAIEIETTNKIEVTSESFETFSIEQSYNENGKLAFTRANFTFLRREGKMKGPLSQGIYPVNGDIHFVHYLADVRSDIETNFSGTVFHAMAFIHETVSSDERKHLLDTMKLFIKEMDISRGDKERFFKL